MNTKEFKELLPKIMSEYDHINLMRMWEVNKTQVHYVVDNPASHTIFFITEDWISLCEETGYTIRFVGYCGTIGTLSEYKQYTTLKGAIEALKVYL